MIPAAYNVDDQHAFDSNVATPDNDDQRLERHKDSISDVVPNQSSEYDGSAKEVEHGNGVNYPSEDSSRAEDENAVTYYEDEHGLEYERKEQLSRVSGKEINVGSDAHERLHDSQDSVLLEASLRSQLFERLRTDALTKKSSTGNMEPLDDGTGNDNGCQKGDKQLLSHENEEEHSDLTGLEKAQVEVKQYAEIAEELISGTDILEKTMLIDRFSGMGEGDLSIQALMNLEVSNDKELEEAQAHLRQCEIYERNALDSYERAKRALAEANAKCTFLNSKREMYSAQLRSMMIENTNQFSTFGTGDYFELQLNQLSGESGKEINIGSDAHEHLHDSQISLLLEASPRSQLNHINNLPDVNTNLIPTTYDVDDQHTFDLNTATPDDIGKSLQRHGVSDNDVVSNQSNEYDDSAEEVENGHGVYCNSEDSSRVEDENVVTYYETEHGLEYERKEQLSRESGKEINIGSDAHERLHDSQDSEASRRSRLFEGLRALNKKSSTHNMEPLDDGTGNVNGCEKGEIIPDKQLLFHENEEKHPDLTDLKMGKNRRSYGQQGSLRKPHNYGSLRDLRRSHGQEYSVRRSYDPRPPPGSSVHDWQKKSGWGTGWGDQKDIQKYQGNQSEYNHGRTNWDNDNTRHLDKGEAWRSDRDKSRYMNRESDFNGQKNRNFGSDGLIRKFDGTEVTKRSDCIARYKVSRFHGEGHNSSSPGRNGNGINRDSYAREQNNSWNKHSKGGGNWNAYRSNTYQASGNGRQTWHWKKAVY